MQPIFATVVGSRLYAINNAQSDMDFKSFGFTSIDNIIGLGHQKQQQYKNDVEDGPDKIEGVCYDIKYYLELCLKGNPTVIEVAFADSKHHIFSSIVGTEVCEFVKSNFLTKHLFKPYSAYSLAQIRKMENTVPIGKRREGFEKFGFDCKFACHAYRLARQATIVMSEGTLRPTLDEADRQVALAIRNGQYTKEEALKLLREVDVQLHDAYKVSKLPDAPDYNKVNDFCKTLYKNYINGNYDYEIRKAAELAPIMQQVKEYTDSKEE